MFHLEMHYIKEVLFILFHVIYKTSEIFNLRVWIYTILIIKIDVQTTKIKRCLAILFF